jgi:O-antigen/teichoic acid export membrane protein
VVAISVFEILSSLLAAEGRASQYTTYTVVNSVLTLGLRLLFISSLVRMDVTAMLWSLALSNAVLVPLMWRRVGLAAPRQVLRLSRSPELRRTARSFVGYGLPMTLWLFSSILLDVGDRWVLNGLLGSDAVGIYDANYRLIGGLAALLVVPVTITVHPYMMSLSGTDDGHVGHVIGTVVDNLVIVTLLAVGLTIVLREDIALVLLGPEFRSGSMIMPLVLAGVFCANIGTFAHKPFELVGRTTPMVVGGFAAAAANVGLCFLLVPAVGYVGAAWATLLSYLLYVVIVGVLGRRIIPWHLDVLRILRLAAVIAAGVAGLLLVRSSAHLDYLAELALTAVGCMALGGAVLLSVIRRPGAGARSEVEA